jgi:hypothetical protein
MTRSMTKSITPREVEASPISAQHRASAAGRGFSVDATITALRHRLNEAVHALREIVASAPADDSNLMALQSLQRRVLECAGSVDLFSPEPPRLHTLFES